MFCGRRMNPEVSTRRTTKKKKRRQGIRKKMYVLVQYTISHILKMEDVPGGMPQAPDAHQAI